MAFFLLTFFLIYGGFHVYFFLKLRAAFAPSAAWQFVLALLLLAAVLAPAIVRICEHYGLEGMARLAAWAGYLWMAFLLLFFCCSVALEIARFAAHLAHQSLPALRGGWGALLLSPRPFFLIPALLALGITLSGVFEARAIRSEPLVIRSAKIPKEAGRIRIVQISDVHVGVLVRNAYLEEILAKVREAAPDILVSTGDLVDGQGNELATAAARFREIQPRFGKFAVTGNHEFYAGLDIALDFTREAGFALLRGNAVEAAGGALAIAGVDDPGAHGFGARGPSDDLQALEKAAKGRYTLLLKHQPLIAGDAGGRFDLQLSGHTHKGQIFPFGLLTRLAFPLHSGNYPLAGGGLLHVSRGSGTWGPPVRVGSPPEITVIDLFPASGPEK